MSVILGLVFLFIFALISLFKGRALKEKVCSIFKKKDINRVYNLAMENQDNPDFSTFKGRIEQYIKLGIHNPTIIEVAEKRLDKYQREKNIGDFIANAVQKGYSIKEAKKLSKGIIKSSSKLNKKEDKNYDVQEEAGQIPRTEETVGSTADADEPRGRRSADATDGYGYGEPRAIPRATAGAGRTGTGAGTRIEPRRDGAIEPRGRNEPRGITTTHPRTITQSRTVPSSSARTSANSKPARQRNIQARDVEEPVKKSGYFG